LISDELRQNRSNEI